MKNKGTPAPYFSVRRYEEEKEAHIYVFGDIAQQKGGLSGLLQASSDQSSYDMAGAVSGIPEDWDIIVHINSNGGSLKEGLGIYNVLKTRNVTTICEGFAASAGSVVFAAGKKRIMQPASLLFIHQAWMEAAGNADDFAKMSEDLRIVTDAAVAAYRESGVNVSDEEMAQMLRAETWITPESAVKMGFATEVSAEEPEDGEIKNDAMRFVMAAMSQSNSADSKVHIPVYIGKHRLENIIAVDKESKAEDEIHEMYAVFKEIMNAAESKPEGFKAIIGTWLNKYAPNPAPLPAQGENRGFFNFKAPENGKGGEA